MNCGFCILVMAGVHGTLQVIMEGLSRASFKLHMEAITLVLEAIPSVSHVCIHSHSFDNI